MLYQAVTQSQKLRPLLRLRRLRPKANALPEQSSGILLAKIEGLYTKECASDLKQKNLNERTQTRAR
jgi:hypothetical protein